MIDESFEDVFTQDWVAAHIQNTEHELVILRQMIPWQELVEQLTCFYHSTQGRIGKSLRTMVALLIVSRFRQLSDGQVVEHVKENRYMQYFCNVSDEELFNFINPSSLCRFRRRLGKKGMERIESSVFKRLRQVGIIDGDTLLMDSTVLPNHLIYPNDVRLIHQAFGKMAAFAKRHQHQIWWDEAHLKKRWRAFGLSKAKQRAAYLAEFYLLFVPALETFQRHIKAREASKKDQQLLVVLELLRAQTQQKLTGERHIENRLVSLDEIDARPIKKGKTYPTCEFGSTVQMTFNRQGFMITTENFIGQPGDATLYADTLQRFRGRMQGVPETVVTDLGFRSQDNFKSTPDTVFNLFLGRSEDVIEEQRDFCRKARSATEGFIAVAKNLRGFGKSLYKRLTGDRIWTLLCQTAYNLKKFMQLYREQKRPSESLRKLTVTT
jgi:IS5 family transposase